MAEVAQHDPAEIRARGVLDDEDLREAELLGDLSRGGRLALTLGIAVAAVAMIAQGAAVLRAEGLVDGVLTSWIAAAMVAVLVFALSVAALRLLAARRRAHRVSGAEVEYVLRPDGLELGDPWSRARLPWNDFSGWNEGDRSFWLYQKSGLCRVLPRRFLDPDDADRLRAWLRQILGEPGTPAAGARLKATPAAAPARAPAGGDTEAGPSITCSGVPEWRDGSASRPAMQRLGAGIYAGALIVMVVASALAAAASFAPQAEPVRHTAATWVPAGAVAGILLAVLWWSDRAARRAWESQRQAASYRLTPRGLRLEQAGETVDLAWTDLESWRESRRTFVFVLGGGRWYFLPRRFLDAAERRTLRAWLEGRESTFRG